MATRTPAVSIIIVSWNTSGLLRDCLNSIQAQTAASHEVIVIDNASSDDSPAMVATEFPDVVLIANTDNRGFAAANNQGLAIARGSHVLLLNPDTIILDHAIDRMLAWLEQHPDVGCAGCQVLESPGAIQRTGFADPNPLHLAMVQFGLLRLARWIPSLGRPEYRDWDRQSEREVDVVTGMFMLVPRHVLDTVGPLDEAFFIYAEEADWCRRIRKAGWKCIITPAAKIIHLDGGGKSTSQIKSRMHVQLQKSLLIYNRKHYGWIGYLTAKIVYIVTSAGRFVLFGALSLFSNTTNTKAHIRLSGASLRYHLLRIFPTS